MRASIARLVVLGVLALILQGVHSVASGAEPIVYDLADDWSDTANPNETWSYRGDDGELISTSIADWDPTNGLFPSPQPAWAKTSFPNPGHVPMWFKAAATGAIDVPVGRIGMHGSEGGTTKFVGVVWASPFGGEVDIAGGVWNAAKALLPGRSSDWRLKKNDTVLTEGTVSTVDAFESSTPFALSAGTGGPSVLLGVPVEPGDELTLEFISPASFATFIGVDLTITLEPSLSILTTNLPAQTVGAPVSLNLEAISGQPPYAWSVVDGAIPPGLTLNPDGTLDGTATVSGEFFFTVRVTDDIGDTNDKALSLVVRQEGVFDLALDWSDTQNPNGVWSYNGAPGTPIATHWDDWDPTSGCCFGPPQPAWADAQWPNSGHVPTWLKVVADTTQPRDFPKGQVIMHGAEGSGPLAQAGVTWTSPVDDVVTISGGVWLVDVTASRSMDWSISVNGTRLTGGSLTPGDPRSSIAPFDFADGDGGPDVLTLAVSVGDVITLDFEKTSTFASFVGVYLTIFSSLNIVSQIPSALVVGEPFTQELETAAGLEPLSWSVVDGELPSGITLDTNGLLTGTPTEVGESRFTIRVVDDSGDSSEKVFSVNVVLVLPPPDIRVEIVGTTPVPGRILNYFVLVENVGDVTARDLLVLDFLDTSQFTLVSVEPKPVIVEEPLANLPALAWIVPEVPPNEARIFTYAAQLNPSIPVGTEVNGGRVYANIDKRKLVLCVAAQIGTIASCGVLCPLTCRGAAASCFTPNYVCAAKVAGCVVCSHVCADWLDLVGQVCLEAAAGASDFDRSTAQIPIDPNEKLVSAGTFIQSNQLLLYPIHFENIGQVEAIDVFITDVLPSSLDDSTLQILSPGATYDPTTRTLRWELLERNLLPGETDNVLFSIKPLPGLPSGTEIRNDAEIQFEIFETLVTPEVVNVIDTTPPACVLNPLPATVPTADFAVSWVASDQVGEVDRLSVFVSEDGGGFVPLLEDTLETELLFSGFDGTTYGFLCVAADTAGNIEPQLDIAEVETLVAVDGDGDGVPDAEDQCLSSAVEPTVVIDGCDSGVANAVLDDPRGCTVTEEILKLAEGARSHGQFVSQVAKLLKGLQRIGVLGPGENDPIMECVAESNLP